MEMEAMRLSVSKTIDLIVYCSCWDCDWSAQTIQTCRSLWPLSEVANTTESNIFFEWSIDIVSRRLREFFCLNICRSICLVGLCNLLQCECIGLAVIDSCRGNMQCAIIWTLIYLIAYRREMKFVRYFVQCSERWDVLDYLENKICKVWREIIFLLLFSETCYLKIICISLKNEVRDRYLKFDYLSEILYCDMFQILDIWKIKEIEKWMNQTP